MAERPADALKPCMRRGNCIFGQHGCCVVQFVAPGRFVRIWNLRLHFPEIDPQRSTETPLRWPTGIGLAHSENENIGPCLVLIAEIALKNVADLSFQTLRKAFAAGACPSDIIPRAADRILQAADSNAWIHLEPLDRLMERCDAIELRRSQGEALPLFGIPFGVKDNIDVADMPTTAACPGFAYTPDRSAYAVQRLIDAGGICMGKTNLDQFATGLSGARSAYGTCASVANPRYVSGGSSSGSAVAVPADQVSFALGTDTGGSGRIPAGFNGIVGIKPSVGRVSTRGLVPNCRSLDCLSIFSGSVSDGMEVLRVVDGFDIDDPYCRNPATTATHVGAADIEGFAFGRLARRDLQFFGMDECESLYEKACDRIARIGGQPIEIDYAPFAEAGQLLFSGPWIAERRSAIEPFASGRPDELLDVIRQVLKVSDKFSAVQAFDGMHRLASLRREVERRFSSISIMVVPTAPRPYGIEEMERNPIELNNRLGYYSYFANLLELCAIAVPNGRLACGVPMGVTLLAPAWSDERLGLIASRFEAETRSGLQASAREPRADGRPLSGVGSAQ